MAETGYVTWVVDNLMRGEAWAAQGGPMKPRTKKSKALEKQALKRARRPRRNQK